MSERIDHVFMADGYLDQAGESIGLDEFAYADIQVKAAQVHATLALVEQQRIANLIALWSVNDTSFSAAAFDSLGSVPAEWGGRAELYPHIKEALGIE